MAKSKPEIKQKSKRGGTRKGAGRKAKPANVIRSEVREVDPDVLVQVDLALRRLAPQCVQNLVILANGGYQRIEEKWAVVQTGPSNLADDTPTKLVLVEKKVSYAEPDRAANQYLLDRVLGKPKQAVEVTGKDGGAIPLMIVIPDNGRSNPENDPAQLGCSDPILIEPG